MALAAEYPFLNIVWSMLLFGLFVIWVWLVIMALMDNFRRDDHSGFAKAFWTIFIILVPILAVLIYFMVRPKMTEQDQRMIEEYDTEQRRAAGYSSADEIAKLNDLKASGAISDAEYEDLKRKAMA
jgi:uncharacterized membrane protein